MAVAPPARNHEACALLEKWGIDPHTVCESDLNRGGYYRLGATYRGGRLERHYTAWPDEFPVDDFFDTLPSHIRERNAA